MVVVLFPWGLWPKWGDLLFLLLALISLSLPSFSPSILANAPGNWLSRWYDPSFLPSFKVLYSGKTKGPICLMLKCRSSYKLHLCHLQRWRRVTSVSWNPYHPQLYGQLCDISTGLCDHSFSRFLWRLIPIFRWADGQNYSCNPAQASSNVVCSGSNLQ